MARHVALALLALLIAPLAAGPAAATVAPPPDVWRVFTTVEAHVRDNYATVRVIADISNRGPDPEFPFVVRIPDDAFVTGLTIDRDGTVHEARIAGREEAREEYEAWKAKEQTGGLVEKTRRTSVYSYLVNVAEFTSVRATLTYERYLAAERGVYDLALEAPVSGFGEDLGARFVVTVDDSDGVAALWSTPTAPQTDGRLDYVVGPRPDLSPTPFVASYTLDPTAAAGTLLTSVLDGRGHFVHRFRAPEDARQLPMDLVLVLDVSGSMAGEKLLQMTDAARQVIASLDADDRLHLVAFASDARAPWEGMLTMTPDARRRAADEVAALIEAGGTNIEAGLRRGFGALSALSASADEGRYPALVLLTDGQPTAGTTSPERLREIARSANGAGADVFGIAFGDDADWALIRHLAHEGGGAAIRVPLGQGAELDLRRFMAALTTPVLRDVRIAYSEGVEPFYPHAPVLFAGSELLVVGTFDPALGIRATVTGRTSEGERRYVAEGAPATSLPFLPRLVAYQKVRAMQENDVPDVAAIRELALANSFVTDHTSLVVTLAARPFDPSRAAEPAPWCADCDQAAWSVSDADTQATGRTVGSPYGYVDKSVALEQRAAPTSPPPSAPTPVPEHGAPEARVPGAPLALVLVALAALALAARRR